MKKTFILVLCFLLVTVNAYADNVFETTKKVLDYFNVQQSENTDILIACKNHAFMDNEERSVFATALKSGLLCTVNGEIDPKSDDLKPIYNGLISYAIKNPEYKIVAGKYDGYKIDSVLITDNIFYLNELNKFDIFNVMVDKQNNAVAVWKADEIKLPTLYKAKIYICGDKNVVLYDVYRYSYNLWIKALDGGKMIESTCGNTLCGYTEDEINLNFMDSEIFFIGDGYENQIKPLFFEF